ncbi:MAG: hypothetical protein ACNS60_15505 [Candidatus Cyclobacteriaceae bacterium M2_1C_046]
MRQILIITFLFGLLTACSDTKPKIVYKGPTETSENNSLVDTAGITLAGLPIHFDSTTYLIHPIGQYTPVKGASKIYVSSYNSGSSGLAVAYRSGFSVSGKLDNLKFQHIDSSNFDALTEKEIKIRSFTFLRSIFNSSKKQILIYSITDKDTNNDSKLNDSDIESLYISGIDGSNFKKLSPELHELVDWQVMDIQNRVYFITL